MKTSKKGIDLIKEFEGFSPVRYLCSAKKVTIGYGHVVLPTDDLKEPISVETATEILKIDLEKAERAVTRLVATPLAQEQFDALVSFVFNVGGGAFQRSTLRMKLNRGEYEDAADEFLKWTRAGGKVNKGLKRRRERERELFLS